MVHHVANLSKEEIEVITKGKRKLTAFSPGACSTLSELQSALILLASDFEDILQQDFSLFIYK